MCGIAGFITAQLMPAEQLNCIAATMARSMQHRGPDDEGIWTDARCGIALAHRRLSIVDLSPAGHQPMTSADGRYVISYNGEVYRLGEIRSRLQRGGRVFRGHSDTEVILESIAADGIEATAAKLIGMFAMAVWDRSERTLTLMRDRLGIKPLYWSKVGGSFLFASELQAFRAHRDFTPRIDQRAVASFLRHNYVPAPATIYEGVHKLEPGTILTLPWRGEPRVSRYWDARAIARSGRRNQLQVSDAELVDQLEALLQDAVACRMIADVPLGAFLSGGIDSSAVVALMQRAGMGRARTFSIGFDIPGYNEAPYAAAVARHLGSDHTELTVTSGLALEVIPKLVEWYHEPFADSSQIPTYLLSRLTRRHVTVALSGDGGDELFAGYNRYSLARNTWGKLSLLPIALRRGIASAVVSVAPDRWNRMLGWLPEKIRPPQIGDKLHKAADVLRLSSADAVYHRLVSHWEPMQLMPAIQEHRGILFDRSVIDDFPDLLDRMQFLDLVTYLPDDILTKLDRASMAVSLEARVPLIDHRVVEFAWRLPDSAKVRNGTSKWALRQMLYRYVPPRLLERPKMGFGIPLGEWLRGPLREWAEGLLAEQRLKQGALLDAATVRHHWHEHVTGKRNWQYLLWDVLMLEAWRERWA